MSFFDSADVWSYFYSHRMMTINDCARTAIPSLFHLFCPSDRVPRTSTLTLPLLRPLFVGSQKNENVGFRWILHEDDRYHEGFVFYYYYYYYYYYFFFFFWFIRSHRFLPCLAMFRGWCSRSFRWGRVGVWAIFRTCLRTIVWTCIWTCIWTCLPTRIFAFEKWQR